MKKPGRSRDHSNPWRQKTQRLLNVEQYKRDLQAMTSAVLLIEERERRRLAEDLHDSLRQAIFRAALLLRRSSLDRQTVREIQAVHREIHETVTALTCELSPLAFGQDGLRSQLECLTKSLKQRYGLKVRLKGGNIGVTLDDNNSVVLVRSIREILMNVAKHAQTKCASLSVRRSDQGLEVKIEDSGVGFELTDQARHIREGRFGLFSVCEGLKYFGGSFEIRSAPGSGTTVTLTVPSKAA